MACNGNPRQIPRSVVVTIGPFYCEIVPQWPDVVHVFYLLVKTQNGLIPDNSVVLAMGKVDVGLLKQRVFYCGRVSNHF